MFKKTNKTKTSVVVANQGGHNKFLLMSTNRLLDGEGLNRLQVHYVVHGAGANKRKSNK